MSSVGNPDFGQDPNNSLLGVPNETRKINSLEEASQACSEYINTYGLGGGNWSGGYVYDTKHKQVAYISYNGRIWEKGSEYYLEA
ncbi:hypothetical protein QTG56_24630 (plasmid) [Rossellomorea sp. AcN35-11]|nr:hypothetical protein [Rossellomorea aquimaris]WJV31822.1 hypothetical protein QTG56_24630 [Rossellomorea sp. AcN35-11]